jgi:hypothetical protein
MPLPAFLQDEVFFNQFSSHRRRQNDMIGEGSLKS